MSKIILRTFPLFFLLLVAGVHPAGAQQVSVYFGMGSATDGATTSAGCSPKFLFDGLTGACEPAPTMGGVFGVIGGDVMIWRHLGVNVEDSFRFAQAPFLPPRGA